MLRRPAHSSRCLPFLAALLLGACATTPRLPPTPAVAPAPGVATRWHAQVAAISEGEDSAERGRAILQRLQDLGIPTRELPFAAGALSGRNIVADVGGPANAPLLLIGAHFDRVPVGRGATDNASGVAAVLELAAALQTRGLAGHRVQVAFWDLEERGLLGAQAWISAAGAAKPALYINFDVFGWGDTLWMMSVTPDGPMAGEATNAARENAMPFRAGPDYPPTDHRAFLQAGIPAVSFSLMAGDEIDGVLQVYSGRPPARLPKVAQVIHTANDTMAQVDTANVPKALQTIEDAIRAWDARR